MAARHPHNPLHGLMARAEAQAEHQPVWEAPVQRRAMQFAAGAAFIALAAGIALIWTWPAEVTPRVVLATSSAAPAPHPSPLAEPTLAPVAQPTGAGLPWLEEAKRPGSPGTASNAAVPGPLPLGVVPDDMPSSP